MTNFFANKYAPIDEMLKLLIAPAVTGNVLWTLGQLFFDNSSHSDHLVSRIFLIVGLGIYLIAHWLMFDSNENQANNWPSIANLFHYALITIIVLATYFDSVYLFCFVTGFFLFNLIFHSLSQNRVVHKKWLILANVVGLGIVFTLKNDPYIAFAAATWAALIIWILARKYSKPVPKPEPTT